MKISMCVRVKYPVDYLHAMIFSLQRQTHTEWEGVVVTDGPNDAARRLVESMGDDRLVFVETPEAKGFWGHPYRDLAISRCTGEWIGLTNDDNYYVPGYLKEMVEGIDLHPDAAMVMCNMLHKDFNWAVCKCRPQVTECDLGNWIVRADIAKSTPWPGNDVADDGRYVERLSVKARHVVLIDKPLFIKN